MNSAGGSFCFNPLEFAHTIYFHQFLVNRLLRCGATTPDVTSHSFSHRSFQCFSLHRHVRRHHDGADAWIA